MVQPSNRQTPDGIRRLRENIKEIILAHQTWANSAAEKSNRDIQRRIQQLETKYAEITSLNDELLMLDANETSDFAIQIESIYLDLLAKLETLLDDRNNADDRYSVAGSEYRSCATDSPSVRLPKLRLPEFNGKAEEWPSFYQRFSSSMRSCKLTNLDRFQYLADCLKDDAAKVIANIPILEENYDTAMDLLRRRYENKRLNLRLNLRNLFALPAAANTNAPNSLRELINVALSTVRAIENLGFKRDTLANELIVQLIASKLDTKSSELWETEQTKTNPAAPTDDDEAENDSYEALMSFLEARLQVVSAVYASSSSKMPITSGVTKPKTKSVLITTTQQQSAKTGANIAPLAASSSIQQANQSRVCPVCGGPHLLFQCTDFHALDVNERYQTVRRLHLCTNCFSRRHWSSSCTSSTCKKCGHKHHTLLHNASTNTSSSAFPTAPASSSSHTSNQTTANGAPTAAAAAASTTPPPNTSVQSPASAVSAVTQRQAAGVLLGTAIVNASSGHRRCSATVLLDGASHVSLITRRLQEELQAPLSATNTNVTGVGNAATHVCHKTKLHISAKQGSFNIDVSPLVVDRITEPLPTEAFTTHIDWDFIGGYELADPQFNSRKEIDILIGADLLYDILLPEFCRIDNKPVLQASHLGWLLIGPYQAAAAPKPAQLRCHVTLARSELIAVKQFLGLDEPPRSKDSRSVEEITCEQIYQETHRRDPVTGRFTLTLPKRPNKILGASRQLAINRLHRNPSAEYRAFLEEYESLGQLSRCAPPQANQLNYYIPHHAVYKNGRIRVVFDASMKSDNGVSLNDILLTGPSIQPTLFEILLRFCSFLHGFSADIVKMFRQFLVNASDRDLQRIVMYDKYGNLIDAQLNTITYGTTPAMFQSTRSLEQTARDGEKEYPAAAEVLRKNTYVDDILAGADTREQMEKLQTELISLLKTACLDLGKWRVVSDPEAPRPLCNDDEGRALGVHWNTGADVFSFPSLAEFKPSSKVLTRRSALSQVSKIFDPLGYLAPISITGKLLIQELWSDTISWDDPVSSDFQQRFDMFLSDAAAAASLTFPRFIGSPRSPTFELHGFSDASKSAYAACVYSRFFDGEQSVITRLLAAKTRVAPQRQPRTIPELELCAAVLLVELLQSVTRAISHSIGRCQAYSDSTIVLAYLSKDATNWVPYVANRVKKIVSSIPAKAWHHVSGEKNPADIATRIQSFNEFKARQNLWLFGPDFLQTPELLPNPSVEFDITALVTVSSPSQVSGTLEIIPHLLHRFSKYSRVLQSVMALLRVKDFLIAKVRGTLHPRGQFTVRERRRAELVILQAVQADVFAHEIKLMLTGKAIPAKSPLRSLAPIIHDGLVRVGGRITHASLPFDQRHPIILPANHQLTKLLVRDCHYFYSHSGAQFMENLLRRRYWLIGNLTSQLQRCIRTCAKCIRFLRRPPQPPFMANLPETRVRPTPPFAVVGVDFAGPFARKPDIRSRSSTELKAYVAVFVCFSTKAVHLDMVADLSTPAFLACLKRFVSRRGLPQILYSDNGTNFVGASNELTRQFDVIMRDPAIQNYSLTCNIEWRFNPPAAPHMGGLWEAAVRSMKGYLCRIIGTQRLVLDELTTFVTEVEAMLNSRPLVPLSSSVNPDALTPGHFLIGRPLVALPDDNGELKNVTITKRWNLVNQLRNHFWRRWSDEYLRSLQKRVKWTSMVPSLQIGDIVLIRDEKAAPLSWPLARITRIYPGKDGITRVVDLVSRNGSQLKRPVHRLVLLRDPTEISPPDTSDADGGGMLA